MAGECGTTSFFSLIQYYEAYLSLQANFQRKQSITFKTLQLDQSFIFSVVLQHLCPGNLLGWQFQTTN